MNKKRIPVTSAIVIALSLSVAQVATPKSRSITVPEEARQTLKEIRMTSIGAEEEADQLRLCIENTTMSPDSHLTRLLALKDEVNKMGQDISRLETERESLAPWERQAVDKILPLLKETAASTESAIEYFNDNRSHLWTPVYRSYADRIWSDTERVDKTLKDYLKYAKAYDQEQESLGAIAGE